jgi:hypothetical protein
VVVTLDTVTRVVDERGPMDIGVIFGRETKSFDETVSLREVLGYVFGYGGSVARATLTVDGMSWSEAVSQRLHDKYDAPIKVGNLAQQGCACWRPSLRATPSVICWRLKPKPR